MKLLGNRIYLIVPTEKRSSLILDDNAKEALKKEFVSKMKKLTVHSVGSSILDIKIGDVVLVEPKALDNSNTIIIDLSETETVLMVNYFDIIGVW